MRNDIKGRKGIVYLFKKYFEIKINIYSGIEKSILFYPLTPPRKIKVKLHPGNG